MKRRDFLLQGSLVATGISYRKLFWNAEHRQDRYSGELFSLFKEPPAKYRPFVRWWWNGDKLEKKEIARELKLLKQAGIGGVEINPIRFPSSTNDLGKRSVKWLSPEWVELLQFTLLEAGSLDLTCDLIVGSGWPYGAEWLQGDERTQMASIAVKKIDGPGDYEVSVYEIFREADPAITAPYSGRTMELMKVYLVPAPLNTIEDATDISDKVDKDTIRFSVDQGSHALYALVSINGFMEVINGAPGASGPVLNHYNAEAVKKYLRKMSAAIGPVSAKIRSFFTDSMELEGANWSHDMLSEFRNRRGYDLNPYLPFILFKTAGMGNIFDYNYGVEFGTALKQQLNRIRYDFELTKTELLMERFVQPFTKWCKENKVLARMQAYGRGYDPLDGSFGPDIPECETWIKEGLGTRMSESDYREGRAYSMINKYVSSAAHLQGKKLISCEELTNTDRVFNATLEILKLASDQSVISGVTHAIFHGFNYSPPEAAFPGWVRYGTFFNERNPWWPYLKYFTAYRARLSAILQQATMFADIAILPPIADMWSLYGAQNEPFPTLVHPPYQTMIWEAIHKNGSGCDYVSEKVIQAASVQNNHLQFGERKYAVLFLINVESMEPSTVKKLYEFIYSGGRVFCIEREPDRSSGWKDHQGRDQEVQNWISKMKNYPDRFIVLKKPTDNFVAWYQQIQAQYNIPSYLHIDKPNPFISQVRYQTKEEEIFFLINSSIDTEFTLNLVFERDITRKKQGWIWNAETGERQLLSLNAGGLPVNLGPAESKLIIFDNYKKRNPVNEPARQGHGSKHLENWAVEWRHIDGNIQTTRIDGLKDVKDMPDFVSFCGTIIYRAAVDMERVETFSFLDLGKVFGVSSLSVNGINCGVQWFGKRIYPIRNAIQAGSNTIEVSIVTTMGNYMKTLKDNAVAQYWTNEKKKDQPIQSMGLLGPVTLY